MGGAERQALILAQELTKKPGIKVFFILFGHGEGMVSEKLKNLNIRYSVIKAPPSRLELLTLYRIILLILRINLSKAEVILPYTWFPNYYCVLISRFIPSVIIWNQRDAGLEFKPDDSIRRMVSKISGFIANSGSAVDFLNDSLGVNREKIRLINNGVIPLKIECDKDEWRRSHGFSNDSYLVTMIGNLHFNKDHGTLIKAFSYLLEKLGSNLNIHLILAGRKDVNYNNLLTLVKELKIDGNVHFLGKVSDIGSLLNASDLFVLSSISEGLPNVILEAMHVGIPIIGTDIPGIREALGNEYADFLARPGDAEDLTEKMLELIRNGFSTEKIIRNQERVKSLFSLNRMINETYNYISELSVESE